LLLADGFNHLADLIAEFPPLRESKFIFIPGPTDPWSADVVPREGIPETFTQRLRQKVPGAIFATNPCRIKYFTQELVVYREDLLNKLRRKCILPPDEEQEPDATRHLIRTVIEQAHLCPLPLEVRPIYWEHDSAMRLYPLPHSVGREFIPHRLTVFLTVFLCLAALALASLGQLILADRFDHYTTEYADCACANPGSFPNSDWTFLVYQAATREYQVSRVP